jgi:hypothetical protein
MASSGMLRRMALVRTDVSEEGSTSVIRVTRIGELEITLAVTINTRNTIIYYTIVFLRNVLASSLILVTLMMEAIRSSET